MVALQVTEKGDLVLPGDHVTLYCRAPKMVLPTRTLVLPLEMAWR